MKHNEIVTSVNNVIRQYDMPLTLRQIYYRLVAAGLIPNRRTSYNGLSAQLVTAREQREIDETRIVDRSRTITDISFNTPGGFLDAAEYTIENQFVRRFWASQETYVEVWVEKDALSQVLAGAIRDTNTIVAPSRGYSSYSYIRDAVNRFQRNRGKASQVVILHFADHDPSGIDMTRDLQTRFSSYSSASRFNVRVKRIALTFDQVQEYDLIPNPTKATDSRTSQYEEQFGGECWELDAIEPNEMIRLVSEAVDAEITDRDAWEETKAQDARERAEIKEHLTELREKFEDNQ